ncbi:hypothetical protein D6829_02325 [Candidatus Pacearchaeota archaeon]|nr:MAG: hypothetical protein D6829_02325 [Candidatus Pacearchaeota archaeon]
MAEDEEGTKKLEELVYQPTFLDPDGNLNIPSARILEESTPLEEFKEAYEVSKRLEGANSNSEFYSLLLGREAGLRVGNKIASNTLESIALQLKGYIKEQEVRFSAKNAEQIYQEIREKAENEIVEPAILAVVNMTDLGYGSESFRDVLQKSKRAIEGLNEMGVYEKDPNEKEKKINKFLEKKFEGLTEFQRSILAPFAELVAQEYVQYFHSKIIEATESYNGGQINATEGFLTEALRILVEEGSKESDDEEKQKRLISTARDISDTTLKTLYIVRARNERDANSSD